MRDTGYAIREETALGGGGDGRASGAAAGGGRLKPGAVRLKPASVERARGREGNGPLLAGRAGVLERERARPRAAIAGLAGDAAVAAAAAAA